MLRKTIHRPNHRERAQPLEREKWGVLEKHKDYTLRARDFQDKKKRLKSLRQKAAERNPDEFRYGMLSSRSKQGRKIAERGNPVLSHGAVKLLKTQDSGYLRSMIQKTRRAIERLEQKFTLQQGQGAELLGRSGYKDGGQHTVFVDSREEQKQYLPATSVLPHSPQSRTSDRSLQKIRKDEDDKQSPDTENEEETAEETMPNPPRRSSTSRRAAQREAETFRQEKYLRRQYEKEQDASRAKLVALKAREKDLIDAENELELQRAQMSNSIGGVTKAGVKWRPRERKK